MRKWKLKKDTPTAVAGTICTTPGDQEHIIVDPYGVEYYVAKIDNLEEWFEEVKEFKEWRPEEGEVYKFLYSNGDAMSISFDGREIDQHYLSIGNCYPLNTPDEVIIKEQKLIPQAMHRLKTAAKKAWFEFDGSEGPDWSNDKQEKWSAYYDHTDRAVTVSSNFFTQRSTLPYFPTRRSYRAYIHNNQDDLKLLFGVE